MTHLEYVLSNPTWARTHATNYATNGYPTRINTFTPDFAKSPIK